MEMPEKSLEALRSGNAVFTRSFTSRRAATAWSCAVLDQSDAARLGAQERPRGRPTAPGARAVEPRGGGGRTEPFPRARSSQRTRSRSGSSRIVPFVAEPTFQPGEAVSLFLVAYPGAKGRRT